MSELIFLGTGAGDKGMLLQKIKTSALYFDFDGIKFILDPGPGAIVNANLSGLDLTGINGLIVTHPHPDHTADANCLIDALRKPGTFLIAAKKCLIETKMYYPSINKFQQHIPEKIYAVEHGDALRIGDVAFEAVRNSHLDCGLGIKILGKKKIGYVGDGTLDDNQEFYHGMDLIIFNVLIPHGKPSVKGIHTSVDDIIKFLKLTKPKKAIIQHFSIEMIDAGIDKQARIIEKETKVATIAAKDGMKIRL